MSVENDGVHGVHHHHHGGFTERGSIQCVCLFAAT